MSIAICVNICTLTLHEFISPLLQTPKRQPHGQGQAKLNEPFKMFVCVPLALKGGKNFDR